MLLSMVLVATAVVLTKRAGEPDDGVRRPTVLADGEPAGVGARRHDGSRHRHRHGRDRRRPARRRRGGAALRRRRSTRPRASTAITVMIALALAVVLAVLVVAPAGRPGAPAGRSASWLFVGLLQAAVGYTQYFNDVPALLVGVHVALADGALGDDRVARPGDARGRTGRRSTTRPRRSCSVSPHMTGEDGKGALAGRRAWVGARVLGVLALAPGCRASAQQATCDSSGVRARVQDQSDDERVPIAGVEIVVVDGAGDEVGRAGDRRHRDRPRLPRRRPGRLHRDAQRGHAARRRRADR